MMDPNLEAQLLEEMAQAGVDVSDYKKRLAHEFLQNRRRATAFDLQISFHRAIDDWRSLTRSAAVEIHKTIESNQVHAETVLKTVLYIETLVSILQGKLAGFEAIVQAQHERFDLALDEKVASANRKLADVVVKVQELDIAVGARIDAHFTGVKTRTEDLSDKCDSAVTKLTAGLESGQALVVSLQGSLHAAEKRIHDVESRASNISRDLTAMDRSMDEFLKSFKAPIVIPALLGGLMGASVGTVVTLLLWQLLAIS